MGSHASLLSTVQSTRGVKRVEPVEGRVLAEALEQLMNDLEIAAVKIGMLGSEEVAKAVAAFLKRYPLRHVVLILLFVQAPAPNLFRTTVCR